MPEPHDDPQERQAAAASGPAPSDSVPMARPSAPTPPTGFSVPMARPVDPALRLEPLHPMLLSASSRASAAADVLIATAALLALEFTFTPLVAMLMGVSLDGEDSATALTQRLLVPMLLLRTGYVLVIIAGMIALRGQRWASVGLCTRRTGVDVLVGMGCPLVAYMLIVPTMLLLGLAFPRAFEQMNENAQNLQQLLPRIPLWQYLPVMGAVGLWEELFFRGFVMTRLRRATGSWVAGVVLSTLVFALLHLFEQTLTALVPITILSVLFSVVTIWRRSLVPAIVGHALFNFSQVAWMQILMRYQEAMG